MKIAHINPDNYLETSEGRMWTPERSKSAWEAAYFDFEVILKNSPNTAEVYIVFGVWIKVPLVVAISQNEARKLDGQVSESALNSVYEQLQAPEMLEGFDKVLIVAMKTRNIKTEL